MTLRTQPRLHHRAARLVNLGLLGASTLWLSGCASLQDTLSMARRDGKAPVVMADVKPVTQLVATQASREEAMAMAEANRKLGVPVISRPIEIDGLKVTSSDVDEARSAVGTPTDDLRPGLRLDLQDLDASSDLWARIRKGYALPELQTELIGEHERWYAARPDYVQRMVERGNRYLFHVVEEVERRKMPLELALLPFIESAFNPQAMSSARASGMWQFMPATGKDFELKQNLFRDDRRDVLASTRAALDYLQRLHRMFGDWHLALAAYNWGEGNVQRAINRNLKAGLPTDYTSLNMPPETRNYVPKLYAVRNIVRQPELYGLTLQPIENHPHFVSVPIQRDMDVALAARLAQLSLADFQALNPSMNKPVILAAGTPQVLLPYDNASLFLQNLQQHRGSLASWTAWVVPRTMRPVDAARQVGMTESELRDINRIPPRMLVKAGSTLLVPRSLTRQQDVSEHIADNAMMDLAPDLPPMRRLFIKAGKRDTVASIAKRYRVSPSQVAQWNKVALATKFKRSQRVVVYVPVKGGSKAGVTVASARTGAKGPAAKVRSAGARKPVKVAAAGKVRASKASNKTGRTSPAARNTRVRVAAANP